jgi:hypothetical protein
MYHPLKQQETSYYTYEVYLWVSCDALNKQPLFPYHSIQLIFAVENRIVLFAAGTESLNVIYC